MTKQLFEEALADVKRVKQVAEENALRALTEAVTPRIREFIDRAILQEDAEGDEMDRVSVAPVATEMGGEMLTDDGSGVVMDGSDACVTSPDAEGKVTLDIDTMCAGNSSADGMPRNVPGPAVPPPMFGEPMPKSDDEYEISLESVDALRSVVNKPINIGGAIEKITESVSLFNKASKIVKETPAYGVHVTQMISRVEDMYDHVQESITDPAKKSSYENALEASFKVLNKLQESTTMSKKKMTEADLTLKLTGLPDDVEDDLENVGVDLITGEEDEEGAEGFEDMGGGDEEAPEGLDDYAVDGDDQMADEEDQQMEGRRLSDDTIVEIDEGMLRREIARLRSLREETKPDSWGNGPGDSEILADFGDGKEEGDPRDQEITDLSPGIASRPLGESDDQDLEEQDDQDLDESDDDDLEEACGEDLDQLQNRRKQDEYGTDVSDGHETATWDKRRHEALRRLNFEKKLQERATVRAVAIKREASRAKASGNTKRFTEAKKEFNTLAKRYNESLARGKKMSLIAAKASKKLQESRSNSAASRPAENKAIGTLRTKLAESNLFNAKLLYTNKLLQSELTAKQKSQVIKQLDEAHTVREAKLVYESLVKTIASPSKSLQEGVDRRQVIGSSSRVNKPASTQTLNEGVETDRWAQLAGIVK
jgi:hypothetical protein